jgi:NAD(P)H dehydrogenase (quinone)
MLRPLLQGSLGYVGYEVFKPFVAYHVPYVTQAERGAMLEQLGREIDALSRREILAFPSLDGYDELLRPLERSAAGMG